MARRGTTEKGVSGGQDRRGGGQEPLAVCYEEGVVCRGGAG
jgi:hypothetical protein